MMSAPNPADPEAVAGRMVARAEVDDPTITGMVAVVVEGSGGFLVGLDRRVKTVESLARKLADMVADEPTLTAEEVARDVYDVLRYTVVAEPEVYVEVHDRVLARLADASVGVVVDSNRWAGPGYRGINARLVVGARRFEVQFHTPESYEAAGATRGYYEEFRRRDTPDDRLRELLGLIDAVFSQVPVPPGVLS
jgi:hypothetical protein